MFAAARAADLQKCERWFGSAVEARLQPSAAMYTALVTASAVTCSQWPNKPARRTCLVEPSFVVLCRFPWLGYALCVAKHCTVFRDENAFRHSKQGDSPIAGLDWWEHNIMRTIASDLCESTAKSTHLVQCIFPRRVLTWSLPNIGWNFPATKWGLAGRQRIQPCGRQVFLEIWPRQKSGPKKL